MDKQKISDILSQKGISGTGGVLGRLEDMGITSHLTLEPGDYVNTEEGFSIAAPIAFDMWYLHNHVNFIELKVREEMREDGEIRYVRADQGEEFLAGMSFLDNLGAKPLRALKDLSQLESLPRTAWELWGSPMLENWQNNGVYWIQQAVFEISLWGEALRAASKYLKEPDYMSVPKDQYYLGYISFPVGQLGVMEVLSVIYETDMEGITSLPESEIPFSQDPPEMFPPRRDVGKNYCYGRHVIESAYLVPDDEKHAVEVHANHPDFYPPVDPKGWLRVAFCYPDERPVPGEFVGLLAKPQVVPPHVWWFQETSPFVYAGAWFETRHLTSGVVLENKGNQFFLIRMQGREVVVSASDFYMYQVGERVAVLKKEGLGDVVEDALAYHNGPFHPFPAAPDAPAEEEEILPPEKWAIIPISFYE